MSLYRLFRSRITAALFIMLTFAVTQANAAQDDGFVKKAARDGIAEVELAKLAADRASDPEVKQFAQRIQQDHQKANQELQQLASQKGISLPSDADRMHQKEEKTLSQLNGTDFDKSYIKELVKDHKKDVKEFDKEAKKGKDSDVKNWAAQNLNTLKDHLQTAQNLEARLK